MQAWVNQAMDNKTTDGGKDDGKMKRVLAGKNVHGGLKKLGEEAKQKAKLRRAQLIHDGLQSGIPRSSVKPMLKDAGLEKYYDYFERAGFDVMESYVRRQDNEIDEMLRTIEQVNQIQFPYSHRVKLWKLFRHKWFTSPVAVKKFIIESEIPDVFLPKPYHRQKDSNIELAQLDPDRVRQITRKQAVPFGDEQFKIEQLENYNRQPDEVYELRDIQRSVQEWQTLDPQKMLRADPREEVFFVRIRKMEMFIANKMSEQRKSDKRHELLKMKLNLLRIVCGVMAFFHIFYTLNSNRDLPASPGGSLWMYFSIGSRTFISGIWFFVGSCFAHGIMGHWTQLPELQRLQRMHMLCKKLSAQLVDFRLESADMRLEKFDIAVDDMSAYFGLKTDDIDYEAVENRLKGKKTFDQWMKDANPAGRKVDLKSIAEQLEDTYDQIAELPRGFERQGGNRRVPEWRRRMISRKLGGADEISRSANPHLAQQMQEINYREGNYIHNSQMEQMHRMEKEKRRIQRRLQRRMEYGDDYSSSEDSSDDDSSDVTDSEEEGTPQLPPPTVAVTSGWSESRGYSSRSSASGSGHQLMEALGPRQAGSMSSSSGTAPNQLAGFPAPRQAGSRASSSGTAPDQQYYTPAAPPLPPPPDATSGQGPSGPPQATPDNNEPGDLPNSEYSTN